MTLHFESGYSGDIINLTLRDADNLVLIHFEMDRAKATDFVNALRGEESNRFLHIENWSLTILDDSIGTLILVGDGSPYLRYKILMTNLQVEDLACTLQMMIVASEQEGRPKDPLPSMDDVLNSGWTPEKEKQMFGHDDLDDPDNNDPSEAWKKGK